jgi:hypothetical protein
MRPEPERHRDSGAENLETLAGNPPAAYRSAGSLRSLASLCRGVNPRPAPGPTSRSPAAVGSIVYASP